MVQARLRRPSSHQIRLPVPATSLQTHSLLEIHTQVQTHALLEKTGDWQVRLGTRILRLVALHFLSFNGDLEHICITMEKWTGAIGPLVEDGQAG